MGLAAQRRQPPLLAPRTDCYMLFWRLRTVVEVLLLMDKILLALRTLNYGNYGIFLIMGNAGFCPSTVCRLFLARESLRAP